MSEMSINKDALIQQIQRYKEEYWNGNALISDIAYDALIETLRKLDPAHELVTKIETGVIGDKKVTHKVPMLSLQKVYSKEELYDWIKKVSRNGGELFKIQPKYDGISCHCENGVYSTRGDGKIGQNISEIFNGLRGEIDFENGKNLKSKSDFYGEIVIKNSDFSTVYKNIKNNAGKVFKTQRNAVAGIFGVDDYTIYAKQNAKITLVDYDKYTFFCTLNDFEMKWDIISQIISKLDYPMDGIVVKLADDSYSKYLGFTEHHPKGQIAFKFENISKWTTLKDIVWGMGKGQITATAVFETIEINGVNITKAVVPMASENLPNIMNGDFTIGTKLFVERAGDVIPHIVKVETNKNGQPFMLQNCPFCGEPLYVDKNVVACHNVFCAERAIQNVYYSLVSLGCKNIGEAIVRDIYNISQITNFNTNSFIQYVTSSVGKNKIASTLGYGTTSANNIVREIMLIKENTQESVLASLNIPNLGKKIAKVLIDEYKTIDNLFSDNTKYSDLSVLPGIGEVMAERIYTSINNIAFRNYVKVYIGWFEFAKETNTNSSTAPWMSKGKVCFTGAMVYERKKMFEIAKKAGFEPIDSVTKDCKLLVMADVNSTSSKAMKARKMGIGIMTDKDFIKNYEN